MKRTLMRVEEWECKEKEAPEYQPICQNYSEDDEIETPRLIQLLVRGTRVRSARLYRQRWSLLQSLEILR